MLDLFPSQDKKTLRPHQVAAIEMIRQSLAQKNRRVVCQMPTGAGKTLTAAKIIDMSLAKGNRVIFTAPAISLIDQTVDAFEAEGIRDIGVMQANHPRTNSLAQVQVASVQTLYRREIPQASLVIVDECHMGFDVIHRMMDERQDVFFVGLSATPWAKGMGLRWQDLVIPCTIGELIEAGYLSRFVAYAPDVPDLSGVKVKAGEYAEAGLEAVMGGAALVGSVVNTWLEKGENRPTLCFAVNRAHAAKLQAEFLAKGVSAEYVDANTDMMERAYINRRFRAGEVKVICSVRTMTTGVDLPVSCVIDAAPTKSEMLHVQKIGRGLRVNPGTEDCVAADTMILTDKGLCEIRHITLDHKVWDGVNFVRHMGAVCKGVRPVISYDGLTATPDHRVMTDDGWKTLAEAAGGRLRIARTGIGRTPIRLVDDCVAERRRERAQSLSRGRLPGLRRTPDGALPQHAKASESVWMQFVQAPAGSQCAALALPEVPRAAGSLLQSAIKVIRSIWSAWDRVPVRKPECGGALGGGKPWHHAASDGVGPGGQRRALRARQSALGAPGAEHRQQPQVEGLQGSLHRLSDGAPRGQVFGSLARGHDPAGDDRRADCPEVGGISGQQSEQEVWDILNAGPLQRFTANGRLVHNCLILDHAGNSIRLGLVTDIHHLALNKQAPGEKEEAKPKAEKLPKPCGKCGTLHAGAICPTCGNERKPVCMVEAADGDLIELTPRKASATMAEKLRFYAMAIWVDRERGKGGRLAKGLYKGRYGVWPKGLAYDAIPPDQAFLNYEKSRRIAYAKKMQGGR